MIIPNRTQVVIRREDVSPQSPQQGGVVTGILEIEDFGKFRFKFFHFDEPGSIVHVYEETQPEHFEEMFQFQLGWKIEELSYEINRFVMKCFLVAWHGYLGHIQGHKDKWVPYPLPNDLRPSPGSKGS